MCCPKGGYVSYFPQCSITALAFLPEHPTPSLFSLPPVSIPAPPPFRPCGRYGSVKCWQGVLLWHRASAVGMRMWKRKRWGRLSQKVDWIQLNHCLPNRDMQAAMFHQPTYVYCGQWPKGHCSPSVKLWPTPANMSCSGSGCQQVVCNNQIFCKCCSASLAVQTNYITLSLIVWFEMSYDLR